MSAAAIRARPVVDPPKIGCVFPELSEIEGMSVDAIYAIWSNNLKLLVGLAERTQRPQIGFHGTNKAGMEGIQKDKASKFGPIFVSSLGAKLDAVRDISCYTVMAQKVIQTYVGGSDMSDPQEGGIFVVNLHATLQERDRQLALLKPELFYFSVKEWTATTIRFLEQDSKEENCFLRTVQHENCAGETTIPLNQANYDKVVLGIVKNDTKYPDSKITALFQTTDTVTYQKGVLVERLRMQEFLLKTFRVLNKGVDWDPATLQKCKEVGERLLTEHLVSSQARGVA